MATFSCFLFNIYLFGIGIKTVKRALIFDLNPKIPITFTPFRS